MAKIRLSEGRTAPLVKPNLLDQMELERQMRKTRKKYGAAQFVADMKLSGFQTAFSIWASYRRAGQEYDIQELLELGLDELYVLIEREPSDPDPDADADEDDDEEEPVADPQSAPTVDAAAGA